jgi:hypothetical protein
MIKDAVNHFYVDESLPQARNYHKKQLLNFEQRIRCRHRPTFAVKFLALRETAEQ